MSTDRHFEPISWLYGLLTRAVFGPPRGAAEEEREWERAEPATLAAALRALDARAAALEALVDPDGTTARPPYDAAEFLATLSRCARLADWLHAPAYDVALRVRRLQWAAKLPLNEAAADDDADARAGLALAARRLEELEAIPRFKTAMASAAGDSAAAAATWRARQIDMWRALDREAEAHAAAADAAAGKGRPGDCAPPACAAPRAKPAARAATGQPPAAAVSAGAAAATAAPATLLARSEAPPQRQIDSAADIGGALSSPTPARARRSLSRRSTRRGVAQGELDGPTPAPTIVT